jgi:hypothetical protein
MTIIKNKSKTDEEYYEELISRPYLRAWSLARIAAS